MRTCAIEITADAGAAEPDRPIYRCVVSQVYAAGATNAVGIDLFGRGILQEQARQLGIEETDAAIDATPVERDWHRNVACLEIEAPADPAALHMHAPLMHARSVVTAESEEPQESGPDLVLVGHAVGTRRPDFGGLPLCARFD